MLIYICLRVLEIGLTEMGEKGIFENAPAFIANILLSAWYKNALLVIDPIGFKGIGILMWQGK